MTNILDKYPTPWKVDKFLGYIQDANSKNLAEFDTIELMEFVTETINNSVRPKITDVQVSCICGWQGTVSDCLLEVNDKGGLGCPECETAIEG